MLLHPVLAYLENYEATSEPGTRLDRLLLAFEYLIRVDALLVAAAVLQENPGLDFEVWSSVLRSRFALGEWLDLFRNLCRLPRRRATEDLVRWFKSCDGAGLLGRLLLTRNVRAHDPNRTSESFVKTALQKAEADFHTCREQHPPLGEVHQTGEDCLEVRQGGRKALAGGLFLLPSSYARRPGTILVYSGMKSGRLAYDDLAGPTFTSVVKFRELIKYLRQAVKSDQVLSDRLPPILLQERLRDHTAQTLERLIAQKRFRPERCIARQDLDALLPAILNGPKRLMILSGPADSGKTTWLCQVAEARRSAGAVILLETADWFSEDHIAECLGRRLRVLGDLPSALERLSEDSPDRVTLVAIDGLEAAGREEQYLLDLFDWVERLKPKSRIRIVATIRAERFNNFCDHRGGAIPRWCTEIVPMRPLSDRALFELAERLPGDDRRSDWVFSARLETAKRLARSAYDSARYPGPAARILEAVQSTPGGPGFSAHKICRDLFLNVAEGGRLPARSIILVTLASVLLTRMVTQVSLGDPELAPIHLLGFGAAPRSADYSALLEASILAERRVEDVMFYVSFVDQRFYEYAASMAFQRLNVDYVAAQLVQLCEKSQTYPLALSVAAFLLIRAMHANGAGKTLEVLRPLGEASTKLLLELAALEGEAFLELLQQLGALEPSRALSLVVVLIRSGEPRVAERAAQLLIDCPAFPRELLDPLRLVRAKAFYEIDDHKSAERELEKIAGQPTYEALALRAEIAAVRGRFDVALAAYEQLARESTNGTAENSTDPLHGMGYVLGRIGRYEEAMTYLRQVIALLEPDGASLSLAEAFGDLGQVLMETGRFEEAENCLCRNLSLCQGLGSLIGEGVAESLIGELYARQRVLSEAEAHLRRGLEIARWVGNRFREAWTLKRLGKLYRQFDRNHEAKEYLRDAADLFHRIGAVDS